MVELLSHCEKQHKENLGKDSRETEGDRDWFIDLGQYVRSPLMYVVYVPSSSCSFHCKNSVRELNLSVWLPANRECVGFLLYAVWLPHRRKLSPLLTLLQSRESLPRFSLCCFSQ